MVKKKEISLLFEFSFVSGFSLVAEKMKEKKETSDFKFGSVWICVKKFCSLVYCLVVEKIEELERKWNLNFIHNHVLFAN